MIYQPKIAYFPLRKAFEKQTEVIEDQGEKQIQSIEEYGKQAAETNPMLRKIILVLLVVKKIVYCF